MVCLSQTSLPSFCVLRLELGKGTPIFSYSLAWDCSLFFAWYNYYIPCLWAPTNHDKVFVCSSPRHFYICGFGPISQLTLSWWIPLMFNVPFVPSLLKSVGVMARLYPPIVFALRGPVGPCRMLPLYTWRRCFCSFSCLQLTHTHRYTHSLPPLFISLSNSPSFCSFSTGEFQQSLFQAHV